MLQSLVKEKKQMTIYPNGVCYLNASLFNSIKKQSQATPVRVAIKTDGNGNIVILTAEKKSLDCRKISLRGGGGSFSYKALSDLFTEATVITFDGPKQIDADNPSGYLSTESFPSLQHNNQ